MRILGINAYHGDSAAAIIIDGQLIAAIEEERIRRIKHWAGFPSESIKWCLAYAGIDIRQVDYVAISRNPLARVHKKFLHLLKKRQTSSFLMDRFSNYSKIISLKKGLAEALRVDEKTVKARLVNVEHHRAHLGSAFFVSPFDQAAAVSVDAFGDFASTVTAVGRNNKIHVIGEVEFPHSLGIFYTAMTQFLGFGKYGDEYKVMGLAAHGSPACLDQLRKVLAIKKDFYGLDTSFFLHDGHGEVMTWSNQQPAIRRLFSDKLVDLLGPSRAPGQSLDQRFRDIAASVQALYEEVYFHILNGVYRKTKLSSLVLAGGCIQNSLANGKIYERTPFKNVYIPPAPYDAGGAIGAAFYVWNQKLSCPRSFVMDGPFWGPGFPDSEVENEIKKMNLKYEKLEESDLIKKTAEAIVQGRVVGWFQGKLEWGARALGARSILADPRRKDMKDILNLRIKKREDFRPFAPSILEEKAKDWFEETRPVPFMEKVYKVKPEKRASIPAVTNLDGTGRLQTVNRISNPKYYALIEHFEMETGVPMILNTSFNENEPIVNTPADALDCFMKTKIDLLVMGNLCISREDLQPSAK